MSCNVFLTSDLEHLFNKWVGKKINIMWYNYTILNLSNYRRKVFIDYFWSSRMIFNTCATSVWSWASAVVEVVFVISVLGCVLWMFYGSQFQHSVTLIYVDGDPASPFLHCWSYFFVVVFSLHFPPPPKSIRFWTTKMSCSQSCPLC